jgi:hypothetical protein
MSAKRSGAFCEEHPCCPYELSCTTKCDSLSHFVQLSCTSTYFSNLFGLTHCWLCHFFLILGAREVAELHSSGPCS